VLARALEKRRKGQRIEVEVRSAAELEQALEHGAEAILLDHMTLAQVKHSVERIKKATAGPTAGEEGKPARWIPTEASGGIVLDTIRAYAETGVDFISVGALTNSAKAADITMSIVAE
jgi:nicotinate-nucleotide pyrophosphorylase (carboxylating)